jgi:hypothetical protein
MNEWVRIGPSKIKGAVEGQNNGLIARKDIPKDQIIAYYQDGADELNETQFRARYPHGKPTHVWSNKAGVYYDGHTPNHIASAAMRGDPKTNKNNARITGSGSVRTTKRIKAEEEIFLAYGGTFTILQAAADARTESSTLDVQPQPRRTAKTILQAAAATRENDVDYWALPRDERMYPNRALLSTLANMHVPTLRTRSDFRGSCATSPSQSVARISMIQRHTHAPS